MKKNLFIIVALVTLVGCGHRANQQPNDDQRKDIAHKLILKSFNDLQNKDLKGTIIDLETSIKINPSEPAAYLLLGQILLKVQEYGHAADFLDEAAKTFPDDGTVSYMLSVADKMAGRKLPAVLAARHSIEVFQAQQDRDNMLKSAALLHELVDMPDKPTTAAGPDAPSADAPDAATATTSPVPEDTTSNAVMPPNGGND